MIIAVPFSAYSSEYMFYNIYSTSYVTMSSRFSKQTQNFFPLIYSTEDIVITGIHIILNTDIDIATNLEHIENEIIQEFSHISTDCVRKIKQEWDAYTKCAPYTDTILFSCKGLLMQGDTYCPQYTIRPVP